MNSKCKARVLPTPDCQPCSESQLRETTRTEQGAGLAKSPASQELCPQEGRPCCQHSPGPRGGRVLLFNFAFAPLNVSEMWLGVAAYNAFPLHKPRWSPTGRFPPARTVALRCRWQGDKPVDREACHSSHENNLTFSPPSLPTPGCLTSAPWTSSYCQPICVR